MRATLLKSTLSALIPAGRSVAIEGAPGGGKTTIVHEVAESLGLPIVERHMPTMLVEDFGIPYPTDNGFEYKLPDWFPHKGKAGTENGGVLLFDDRNQANADLQKVLANIQQARTLHGVPLADGWTVISTGNRQSDRAGANRIWLVSAPGYRTHVGTCEALAAGIAGDEHEMVVRVRPDDELFEAVGLTTILP